ncbi:MAG: DUF1844 domain-containing protein [Myxococcota bacterium]|nr:DUF1844 domain-containing protein [Myxococcota bacterium]
MGDEERGFTIVDKRGQDEEGEAPAGASAEAAGPEPQAGAEAAGLPAADFTSLLLSLGTSALYHLGQVDDPSGEGPSEVNLPLARHAIGTLEVLEEKTAGNRTEEETGLLTSLLTDLRMRFVNASNQAS